MLKVVISIDGVIGLLYFSFALSIVFFLQISSMNVYCFKKKKFHQ